MLPYWEGNITVDELLTLKQAMEFLGVSEKVLLRLLAEEDMPGRKLGKEWRFSKQALIQWVAEGKTRDYSKVQVNDDEE